MSAERLVVGLVRGVHGLRGLVRVEVLTDNDDRFAPGSVLAPEGTDRQLTVVSAHRDGPGLLVKFAEVADRNAADALRNRYLESQVDGVLPEATYYWHEIIGCRALSTAGDDLGTVADVFRVGESEIYVVRGGRGELLIPAVRSIVRELVPAEGRMVVDLDALGLAGEEP